MMKNYLKSIIEPLTSAKARKTISMYDKEMSLTKVESTILERYTFLNQPRGSPYWVPTWAKMIVIHRYMINSPKDVIHHFGKGLI
mmetsp:Transcript_21351/g.33030  ORF Transcript_21351/g.33030 Transcript_21351/m.33030 type:complete len:85 (+) Transcript_21351:237-491(+)